ncbi:hypothetical protein FSOLCH5_007070 [Fusarium solani]
MGESGTAAPAEADGSEASKRDLPRTVDVDAAGDIVLDVTFETSIGTLKKSRKAAIAASRKAGTQPPQAFGSEVEGSGGISCQPGSPEEALQVLFQPALEFAVPRSQNYIGCP